MPTQIILDKGSYEWVFGKIERRYKKKSTLQKILSKKARFYKAFVDANRLYKALNWVD